jgi:uncharacterized protein (TIGR01777 family)
VSKRVLLSGATGFVGQELGHALNARGDRVLAVVRDREKAKKEIRFPAELLSWEELKRHQNLKLDAIVHLAGESVAQRWTASAKKKILASRIETAQQLRALAEAQEKQPAVFVSASAIGFYGNRGEDWLAENAASGQDFLSQVCVEWERAAQSFAELVGRVVVLRFGLVLGAGGALAKMLPPFRMGVGGRLGGGQQWMSWIHLKDLVRLLLFALDESQIKGIYNAVAPEPVRNIVFTENIAKVLGRPALLPVPAFALRLALGEIS